MFLTNKPFRKDVSKEEINKQIKKERRKKN